MRTCKTTPAAGTADVLNEKDLQCIARHISEHVESSKHESESGFGRACAECEYALTNTCTVKENHTDPWPTFGKLSRITGVSISPLMDKQG